MTSQQEPDIDRDYISPDSPLPETGLSPLAKLQETCRSIGNDMPVPRKREMRSSPPYRKRTPNSPPHIHKDKLKSVSSTSPRSYPTMMETCQPPAISLPSPVISPLTSPTGAPCQQNDMSQYMAQYQLMYQKLLYQAELDKLTSLSAQQTMNNPFLPPPVSTANLFAPESLNPSPPSSATDFAKLAAFFYQKLQQQNMPAAPTLAPPTSTNHNMLGATTEALLNYRKIFSDSTNNFLSPSFPSVPKPEVKPLLPPVPKPQVHECHWVTSEGYCGKKHYSYDDLMLHLRSHVSNTLDTAPLLSPPSKYNPSNICGSQTTDFMKTVNHPLRFQPYAMPSMLRHHFPTPFTPLV